jgi:hypothetical protein
MGDRKEADRGRRSASPFPPARRGLQPAVGEGDDPDGQRPSTTTRVSRTSGRTSKWPAICVASRPPRSRPATLVPAPALAGRLSEAAEAAIGLRQFEADVAAEHDQVARRPGPVRVSGRKAVVGFPTLCWVHRRADAPEAASKPVRRVHEPPRQSPAPTALRRPVRPKSAIRLPAATRASSRIGSAIAGTVISRR